MITLIDRKLGRMEHQVDHPVPKRPLWKRIALPLSGLVMVLVGICFIPTPIPLSILVIIGFPLLFCFNRRIEGRSRDWMSGRLERLRIWVRGWRRLRDR